MTMSALIVAGVWRREWEEDPIGDSEGADRETLVLWIQTPSGIYVDLRLPPRSPGRSIEATRALGITPRPQALALAGLNIEAIRSVTKHQGLLDVMERQKSFAGYLDYRTGDTTSGEARQKDKVLADLAEAAKGNDQALGLCTCFWRRDLDFQPPSGSLDVGVCAPEPKKDDGSIVLRETGQDASYAEGWLRIAGTESGPFAALELVSENGMVGARKGYWVRTGDRFAYAVGRPTNFDATASLGCTERSHEVQTFESKSLAEAATLLTRSLEDRLNIAASYVAVAGKIESDGRWSILHSTNPELVGCALVSSLPADNLCCSTLQWRCSVGNKLEQTLLFSQAPIKRLWRVLELSDCTLPMVGAV